MIKLLIASFISNISVFILEITSSQFFIQITTPPIIHQSAESLQSFILQLLQIIVSFASVVFTFIVALRVKKVNTEVGTVNKTMASIGTTVTEVKTGLGGVHTEVEQLKKNTDGALKEMIDVKEKLSKQLGIQEGIDKSKAEHEAQSEKEKESNIAKGVLQGKEAAEAKQPPLTPSTEPTDVKIVNEESNPAEVAVNEKKKESDK